jgi:hypothetical protein
MSTWGCAVKVTDLSRLCTRRWNFGPPAGTHKQAFTLATRCDLSTFGLSATWDASQSESELEVQVGPITVGLTGPPPPGADDDFEQTMAVNAAGYTLVGHFTRNFAGLHAAWGRQRGGGIFARLLAGRIGFTVEPTEHPPPDFDEHACSHQVSSRR